MENIIDFLKENSSWLKDITTIIFTATGTLIAILSYKRAKSSIFQPKRNEVAKIQTQLLTEFLVLFTTNGNSIDRAIDYINIYKYNVDMALREYNLTDIDKIKNKYAEYKQNIAGWFEFLENDIYNFVIIEGNIQEYDELFFEANNRKREKAYEQSVKNGIVEINRIFFTKKHIEFHKKVRDLSNNPFLPKDIQDVANQIRENMTANLHHNLKILLAKLVNDINKAYHDKESDDYEILSEKYKYQTLWRTFETERKQHKKDYELLKKRIREHLLIDKE
ncbi:hypothetical protein [Zobellia laminariae]|uniref:hypothetical protein n=1 Tax=Zobellia laminariae TaxID=248906 RepID=UPI0026F45368|nr:hypothetical protein [Zobellia laminariae]WKX77935.1 hypothetical protein Q5W13_08320 [Zobellia laminariae]